MLPLKYLRKCVVMQSEVIQANHNTSHVQAT